VKGLVVGHPTLPSQTKPQCQGTTAEIAPSPWLAQDSKLESKSKIQPFITYKKHISLTKISIVLGWKIQNQSYKLMYTECRQE
jgi:hypothetical protein